MHAKRYEEMNGALDTDRRLSWCWHVRPRHLLAVRTLAHDRQVVSVLVPLNLHRGCGRSSAEREFVDLRAVAIEYTHATIRADRSDVLVRGVPSEQHAAATMMALADAEQLLLHTREEADIEGEGRTCDSARVRVCRRSYSIDTGVLRIRLLSPLRAYHLFALRMRRALDGTLCRARRRIGPFKSHSANHALHLLIDTQYTV
jgi:hypothetical protein